MDRLLLTDELTGEDVRIVDWDFRNINASDFKKNFKEMIQNPLKRLLNDFNRDPHVQMPETLKESMLGLIRDLINYYYYMASQPSHQKQWNLLEMIGNQTNPKVAWIHFPSVTKAFKTCLSIIDAKNRPSMPFVFMIRSVGEVRDVFSKDASFLSQMMRVHGGARPGYFPLVISWKLQELVPTTLPDTFMETKVVSLFSEEEIKGTTFTPDVSKESFLLDSLLADKSLQVYIGGDCAFCKKSGVHRLDRCSKCRVARYCGRVCQTEHWKIEHKHHCKRLLQLRLEANRKAEEEEAA